MVTRFLLGAIIFICSQGVYSLTVNFNQAWFHDHYGHQYSNKSYDPTEVERIFRLAKEAHTKSLRLWFFERLDMVKFESGVPVSLDKDYVENVISTFQIAKKYEVSIFMTLFNAHILDPFQHSLSLIKKYRSIISGRNQKHFLENILLPLLKQLKEAKLLDSIDKIDLVNEMDTFVNRFGFKDRWSGAQRMLCSWKSALKSYQIPLSFSVRLHHLTPLPSSFFDTDHGPMKCADYFSVHSYYDSGKIIRCEELKRSKIPVVLGEFGQFFFNKRFDDDLQLSNTKSHLKFAKACGVEEAYAWRLSDIRKGENQEARYSYEAYGKLRPAYFYIQEFNL